jgi:hypothetical protein
MVAGVALDPEVDKDGRVRADAAALGFKSIEEAANPATSVARARADTRMVFTRWLTQATARKN